MTYLNEILTDPFLRFNLDS